MKLVEDILPQIPLKAAYDEAIRVNSALVEIESQRFRKCDEENPYAIALRFVSYWELRWEIFRHFNSIRIDDIPFKSSPFIILPKDEAERSLVFLHVKDSNSVVDPRTLFYLGHSLAENPNGCAMIVHFNRSLWESNLTSAFGDALNRAMPCQLKQIYLTCEENSRDLFTTVLPFIPHVLGKVVGDLCVPIFKASDFQRHGIPESSLPPVLGGTFGTTVFGETDTFLLERRAIEADLYGALGLVEGVQFTTPPTPTDPILEETRNATSTLAQACLKMIEALDYISDKKDFLEAVQANCSLFRTESDPLKFLRTENMNSLAAAKRIVKYWTMRREIFCERAFCPLSLHTESSALTPTDIEVFKSGYFHPLPNDTKNRAVAMFDDSRRPEQQDKNVHLKIFIYTLAILAENEMTQAEGYVAVGFFQSKYSSQNLSPKVVTELVEKALPIKIKVIFLIDRGYDEAHKRGGGFLARLFPFLIQTYSRFFTNIFRPIFASSQEEVLDTLIENGFAKSGIPVTLGGNWTYEKDFKAWLVERMQRDAQAWRALSMVPTKTYDRRSSLPSTSDEAALYAKGLDAMYEYIDQMPEEMNGAFIEATERAPRLVDNESKPLWFLRCTRYDAKESAERLAQYWRTRKQIFGDRAFRPLNLSNDGAFTIDDLREMKNGFYINIPNDADERPVILYDGERNKSKDMTRMFRLAFYTLSVAAQNEMAQRDGYILLVVANKASMQHHTRLPAAVVEIVWNSLPIRSYRKYLVCPNPEEQKESFMKYILPSYFRAFRGGYVRSLVPVFASTHSQLLTRLLELGLRKHGIPDIFGGDWHFESFEKRLLSEASSLQETLFEDTSSMKIPEHKMESDIQSAIRLIPPKDKQQYLEAVFRCPNIVELETEVSRFLRSSEMDTWLAAQRLFAYWRIRKELFQNRAWLPLTQTGRGALSKGDIEFLKTCAVAKVTEKSDGSPVLILDRSLLPDRVDQLSLLRCIFYLLHVSSDDRASQEEGMIFVFLSSGKAWKASFTSALKRLLDALPVRLRSIHFVSASPLSEENAFETMLPLSTLSSDRMNSNVHMLDLPSKVAAKLASEDGISVNCVPRRYGGKWSIECFREWCEERAQVDVDTEKKFLESAKRNTTESKRLQKISELSESQVQEAMSTFEEALRMIPLFEKTDYLEALRMSPNVVSFETPPMNFLECEGYDSFKAARRLVTYWTLRKSLFGHRAHYPLKQSGESALSSDDLSVLNTGFVTPLPDSSRSSIVMYDSDRLVAQSIFSASSKARALFYILHSLSMDRLKLVDDRLSVVFKSGVDDWDFGRTFSKIVREIMPVKFEAFHLIVTQTKDLSSALMSTDLRALFMEEILGDNTIVYSPVDDDTLQEQLRDAGFDLASVPRSVGGEWSYSNFEDWLVDRQEKERRLVFPMMSSVNESILGKRMPSFDEHASLMNPGLVSILNTMDKDETSSLADALRKNPKVVTEESTLPSVSLNFDVEVVRAKAAKLARYWNTRIQTFGEEGFDFILSDHPKAWRRMLGQAYIRQLNDDSDACPVIWINITQVASDDRSSFLKALFYFLQVSTTEKSEALQLHVLISLPSAFENPGVMNLVVKIAELLTEDSGVSQVGLKAIRLISTSYDFGTIERFASDIESLVPRNTLDRLFFHSDGSPEQLISTLLLHGIEDDALERSLKATTSQSREMLSKKKKAPKGKTKPESMEVDDNESSPSAKEENIEEIFEYSVARLPYEEKSALKDAQKQVPDIVERDSPIDTFVRFEAGDYLRAAKRMGSYWEKRKELFGDRATKLMNQTGEGCLGREDIAVFNTGFLALLPRDANNRSVVCYDISRAPSMDPKVFMRDFFYTWSVVSQNPQSQLDGSVLVIVLDGPLSDNVPLQEALEVIHSSLPQRIVMIHVVNSAKQDNKHEFLSKVAPTIFGKVDESIRKCVKVHFGFTRASLASKLENYGLSKDTIPKSLGGNWSYENFALWQEQQMRFEWDLPASKQTIDLVPHYDVTKFADLTAEEKTERRRRMNVLHSRRKRERQRIETEVLQEQTQEIEADNEKLRRENDHLEKLVNSATALVADIEGRDGQANKRLRVDGGSLPYSNVAGLPSSVNSGQYLGVVMPPMLPTSFMIGGVQNQQSTISSAASWGLAELAALQQLQRQQQQQQQQQGGRQSNFYQQSLHPRR